MSWWDDDDYYYRPSQPREAKGGIKAQSRRGAFGRNWWAKRWIDVLEVFYPGSRLGRGKTYARNGQVLSIEIEQGMVTAAVQGSRRRPYDVSIKVKTIPGTGWQKVLRGLGRQALFTAKLLAGEMPPDIETVFNAAGVSLFPEKRADLVTSCSCPDFANPCKHIAAVYYLLGEEFDRDPFLIFKLRGRDREELLGGLSSPDAVENPAEPAPILPAEELSPQREAFWAGGEMPPDLWGEVRVPQVPAALVRQLGNFPFWRGKDRLAETMEKVYTIASANALEMLAELSGDDSDLSSPSED